jgi:fatty acid elongase 3
MPHYGTCAGEEFAAIAGCVILSSYLLLFLSFYAVTYKKTGKKGHKRRNTATKALIDMAHTQVPSVDQTPEKRSEAATSARSAGPTTRSRKA